MPCRRPGPGISPAVVLFLAWGIGVLGLVTVQFARSARRRTRLRAAMEPLPSEVGRRIDVLRAELGLRRAVDARVVRDETIGGPVVQGSVRPCILLPASLVRSWSRKELDVVLLHELVHLRRLDPVTRALGNLLQIAYFFHPVVWWVRRRLAEEREKACDDAVVRHLRGDKRNYMKGLLRLVEERAGGWHGMHPELRMAAGRRPLARRLKRMLHCHYDPSPKVGAIAVTAIVLSVSVGLGLSTEARGGTEVQRQTAPQIVARTVWLGAFFVDSVAQLDDADRVEVGGDFTIGRRATAVQPDAEALADESPALFDRLEALGRMSARIIVDRAGAVRRVRFDGDVDQDLQEPFLDVLDAARFAPTTHFERGPVMVEVRVDYWINPVLPRQSLYEEGQRLVGDEVAEMMASQAMLRRYAYVSQRGEPPVIDVGDEEWILSFGVPVDARGDVESAQLLRDSRTGPNAEPRSTPEAERLIQYIETFSFEPVVARDGSPGPATLVLDLRVSPRGVEVATRAASEEQLERRLREVYRLGAGRNLDLRPPPHPPERMVLYRTGHPIQARLIPRGPDMMTIVWEDDRPWLQAASFGWPVNLLRVVSALGFRQGAVRFEGGAEDTPISADIVKRDGASPDELLADLPQVLRERFELELSVQVISEPSRTLVLRGSVGTVPPDDQRDGQRVLHVFTDRRNEDQSGAGGGPSTDAGMLVELLSDQLEMQVVDETTGSAAQPFHVQIHDSAYGTERLDLLTQNIESQTDLDITVEERLERIVVVRPAD